MSLNRRQALATLMAGAALAGAAGGEARAQRIETSARIVILGAGAAGAALANRLSERLDGAVITVIDPRVEHWYQPGFTLIAAGLKPASYSVSRTTDWLPRGATLLAEAVAEIDPEAKTVTTESGVSVGYDYLVVATGLVLDWGAIEGFSLDLVGQGNGIGAVYASPEHAAKTWAEMDRFTETGGRAVFLRPATEMKCAGAPLKYAFLTDDYARRKGTRGRSEFIYAANNQSLFGVPIVNEKLRMLFERQEIGVVHDHVLKAIDPGAKTLTFDTPGGEETLEFDFTNVIPPMRAPEAVRNNSPLGWQEGPWSADGWLEVDRATLRHVRYPEVWAAGDIAGVPKGKTAASAKWQVPVVEDGIVSAIAGTEATETYDGYTSCPLITRVGRAMLIEFDYHNNLVPSFPGVIAPLEELWISWLMKEVALKATYNAMLRGRA
ncbi:NAD(P)/FAD-dependent oxidoreductase [Histidinibacterium lentulum]|uniref:NAD(P)/FAD-dependent oxidoreductase n=1 Tax=Histidinibacterium lentulum TaxID=2480588 RepID=A0A3N2R539_9RHOB|nr:FAD/NAD(P)-binding oxidoreductase [Histidinibacterium lentulum]ROU02481.1 NAD(P)/FAD-dependent oxidoreductase [Histidinibacterium lentulum]